MAIGRLEGDKARFRSGGLTEEAGKGRGIPFGIQGLHPIQDVRLVAEFHVVGQAEPPADTYPSSNAQFCEACPPLTAPASS